MYPQPPPGTPQPPGGGVPPGGGAPPGPPGPYGGPGGPYFPPPPPRPKRYGTGVIAVLTVVGILSGAAVLGGGITAAHLLTGGGPAVVAVEREPEEARPAPEPSPTPTPEPSPTPVEEPTEEPSREPVEPMSAGDLVAELRKDYDISGRTDTTDEFCVEDEDEEAPNLFVCHSATDTNLVRVVAFNNILIASAAAIGLQNGEDGNSIDVQPACHFVLIWFEEMGTSQEERDDMTRSAETIAGC